MGKSIEEIIVREITKKVVNLAVEARAFSLDTNISTRGEITLIDIKTKCNVFQCTSWQEFQAFLSGIRYGRENDIKLKYMGL